METYIVTIFAKPGHEGDVARFYRDMEPLMRQAKGYRGRRIFKARTGAMAAVKKIYSPEELARLHEPPHADPGIQFVMVEHWDSIDDRLQFSKGVAGARTKALIPHIQAGHSHEFYEEIALP